MLEFTDSPYQFFAPNRSPTLAWLVGLFNRWVELPRKRQVAAVQVSGQDQLLAGRRDGDRLLLLPNHPTHSDPQIFFESVRQIGLRIHVMAAYDVFVRSRLNAWMMPRLGVFSVDREGSDSRAMKQATETLMVGRYALTIFPEGNVYLQNDRVTPFHDGPAFLALKAARTLANQGARVVAVPVAIKTTYIRDVREAALEQLHALASAVDASVDSNTEPLELLRSVGIAALQRNLKHRGIPFDDGQPLPQMIQQTAETVLARLEEKMALKARPRDAIIERVRRARRAIHQSRTDAERAADHAAAAVWADEAMLAFRIASYSGNYVHSHPSLDRFAETVEKLDEDIYSHVPQPFGKRHAFVHFADPIDLTRYLAAYESKAREAIRTLTEDVESAVQHGLDTINAKNTHAGAKCFVAVE